MSTAPVPHPKPRHALNMPAGSIRALLAFGVLASLWVLVLRPGGDEGPLANPEASLAFIYLQFLMILILAPFFTAHGHTIGSQVSNRSPLGLPKGTVRFLLLAGYLGLAAYLLHTKPRFEMPETGNMILLPLVLITGFFLGHVITGGMWVLAGGTLPAWFQDLQAWVALVALFLLGAIIIVRLVINTSLPLESRIDIPLTEAILAGLVGFYFGARS